MNLCPAALTLVLATSVPALTAEPLTLDVRARLAATVAEFQQRSGPPALTVLIDRGGETVFTTSLGLADVADQRPAGPDSVYAIGSITKSFTALAVLQLVEQDRLGLDDPVAKLLPEYTGPATRVTLRQLLTHTAGVPSYTGDIPGLYPRLERNAWARPELVATFSALPLLFEPGTRWSYSNSGYYLLGLIVEKTTGLDYYEYLAKHVLAPLGLRRTFSGDDTELIPGRVRGYTRGRADLRHAAPWHHLLPFSAGSLLSSAQDLARYRRGVFTAQGFSPQLRELLTRTEPLADGTPNAYALGALVVADFHGHRRLSHSGEIYGFHSDHAYYPEQDLTIVVLANAGHLLPAPESLEHKLARIVLGVPAPARHPVTLTAEQLTRLAGAYEMRPFLLGAERLYFAVEGGQLVVRFGAPEAPAERLVSLDERRFVSVTDDEWTFEFDLPSRGPAAGFRMGLVDAVLTGFRATP